MRIIVAGVLSRCPLLAGSVWYRLQQVLGLRRLGHDVYYVEEILPGQAVDSCGRSIDYGRSANREIFSTVLSQFGLWEKACQIYNSGETTLGLSLTALTDVAKQADLLVNLDGHLKTEAILANVKRRAYLDTDPVYTQLWHAAYGVDMNFGRHDVFLSRGMNIGAESSIPNCGLHWRPALPSVLMDQWLCEFDSSCTRFTTIASWSTYHDLSYKDNWYRSKYPEFARFATLPNQTGRSFEVLLQAYRPTDEGILLLQKGGWIISRSGSVADLQGYQSHIAKARGEIGIAKNAYVVSQCGWFSERSAQYLASGKPVLAQSTGFERVLPTGRGLLVFRNMEEAIAGIEKINEDYEGHCRAARELAAEYLDYSKVVPQILEACMG